jgi:hypothetical protein
VLVYLGVVGLAMIDIVWVISTTTPLLITTPSVTCIAITCEDADMDCFILEERG